MGIKYVNFVVFWTISTIKDKKSAAKFHYIKTVNSKVVTQSIAFRVVSIYWQEVAPFPWYLNAKDRPPLEAPALHTLRLIARQRWRHCITSLRSAHWLASSLKLAARCPVSGCWPSCLQYMWQSSDGSDTAGEVETLFYSSSDEISRVVRNWRHFFHCCGIRKKNWELWKIGLDRAGLEKIGLKQRWTVVCFCSLVGG